MEVQQLLEVLTPIIIWAITQVVKYVKPNISGWILVGVVVPLLGAALTAINTFALGNQSWLIQFALGFVAVAIAELIKQFKQANESGFTVSKNG